ncbi:hypothetical protein OKW42_004485 [Paraburkholderia sp. WC7.3d]
MLFVQNCCKASEPVINACEFSKTFDVSLMDRGVSASRYFLNIDPQLGANEPYDHNLLFSYSCRCTVRPSARSNESPTSSRLIRWIWSTENRCSGSKKYCMGQTNVPGVVYRPSNVTMNVLSICRSRFRVYCLRVAAWMHWPMVASSVGVYPSRESASPAAPMARCITSASTSDSVPHPSPDSTARRARRGAPLWKVGVSSVPSFAFSDFLFRSRYGFFQCLSCEFTVLC